MALVFGLFCLLASTGQATVCGDVNQSGAVDIADLVYLVSYMFQSGPPPVLEPLADCNGDGSTDISDLILLVNWMFQGGPPLTCGMDVIEGHTDIQGDCLTLKANQDVAEEMIVEVSGDTITVYHNGAYYQCCLEYQVDYLVTGPIIWAIERDTGFECDCICYFDLQSSSWGYPEGNYTLIMLGIEHQIVGTAPVTIGYGPHVTSVEHSDCLETKSTRDAAQINYLWENGILTFSHHNAVFNCAFVLDFNFVQAGDTLRLYETNVSEQGAYCICDYDITAVIENIAAGSYVAEVYAKDFGDEDFYLVDQRPLILEE